MANLKEIDLDNHFVMEIPAGQKTALATAVAIDNGWKEIAEYSLTWLKKNGL